MNLIEMRAEVPLTADAGDVSNHSQFTQGEIELTLAREPTMPDSQRWRRSVSENKSRSLDKPTGHGNSGHRCDVRLKRPLV